MIALLHHQEQIQRIGLVDRLVAQRARFEVDHARSVDLGHAPMRLLCGRRVNEIDQRQDLYLGQLVPERRHLRRGATFADGLHRPRRFQTLQILRQQCRARAAKSVGAVALRAVLGEQKLYGAVRSLCLRGELQ